MILYKNYTKNIRTKLNGMRRWWTYSGLSYHLFICCQENNITKHDPLKLSRVWSEDENNK